MALFADIVVGGLTLLFGLGGSVYALSAVREFLEAVRVVTGPEVLPDDDEERATYLDVTVAGDVDGRGVALGQVHDTYGYWLLRYWASSSSSNAFGLVGAVLLKRLYGPDDYRSGDDRRRGWATVPDTVAVRDGSRRLELALGEDALPLQRLETDGGTVPFLAGAGTVLVGLVVLVSPALSFLVATYPLVGLAVVVPLVVVPVGLAAGKLYHDTGLVGRWERVVGLDDDVVPADVAAAGDAPDPDGTAKVDLATAEPGDPLRVVGTVASTPEGLRVVDGVVSTRGRWFLAVAATLDAVRTLAFALLALVLAAVGVVVLFPSLLAGLPGV